MLRDSRRIAERGSVLDNGYSPSHFLRRYRNSNEIASASGSPPVKLRLCRRASSTFPGLLLEQGYAAIAAAEPERIKVIDATDSVDAINQRVWQLVTPLLPPVPSGVAG